MGILTNIEAALNTRLATLSGSPPVQWPNTRYQPVENTAFIRPTLLPAQTVLETLDGSEIHKGIYQVDVFVPLEKGVSAIDTLLDSIASLYRSNKIMTATNTIWVQGISRGPANREESWYTSYIEVNYLCHS